MLYAFTATLAGGLLGVVLGEALIPELVVKTYKIMYVNLTKIASFVNIPYAVTAVIIAVLLHNGCGADCLPSLLERKILLRLCDRKLPRRAKRYSLKKIQGLLGKAQLLAKRLPFETFLRYKKSDFI